MISLQVTGNGQFQGSSTNLSGYTVTEDATPREGSNNKGGTGTLEFTVVENPASDGSILLMNDTVSMTDGSNGVTSGIVYTFDTTDGVVKLSANSIINAMIATVTAAPYTGTLGGACTYYLGLVGITTGIQIDSTITARSVSYQGFAGSLWDYFKQLCVVQQIEISLVSNNVVVRPIRQRIAQIAKNASVQLTISNSNISQAVEAYYYSNVRKVNGVAYPLGGDSSLVSAYQVDAGKTLSENIPVSVSFETINQPIATTPAGIAPIYTGTSSLYTVAGQDGTPIDPAIWMAAGGFISAAIGIDGKSIDVKIHAPDGLGNAPYTIGVSVGASNYYAGLFITGTGVFFTPTIVHAITGAPFSKTATLIGATVNTIFATSAADAASLALATAQQWAGPAQSIKVTATVVNRPGDKGDQSYATFAQFDASISGAFSVFDTAYSGKSFTQFNTAQQALVANNFENQAFGNIAGARVLYRSAYYRITTATITETSISYTAEIDTIFSDHDTLWSGKTFAQFDTRWSGKAFADYAMIPLWT